MADAAWEKLHDGKTFKVYRDGDFLLRYTVADPEGRVVACTSTLWGARRVIRRAVRRARKAEWWNAPIVAEVADPGGADA